MNKKILYSLLAGCMAFVMSTTPVLASEFTKGDSTPDSKDVPVSLNVTAEYTVKLPAEITLAKRPNLNIYSGTGTVQIKGVIPADEYIELDVTGANAQGLSDLKDALAVADTTYDKVATSNSSGNPSPSETLNSVLDNTPTMAAFDLNDTSSSLKADEMYAGMNKKIWKNSPAPNEVELKANYDNTASIYVHGAMPTKVGSYSGNVGITYQKKTTSP